MATEHKDTESMTTSEAGHMGGHKVRELVEKGKEAESQGGNFHEKLADKQESSDKREDNR